MFNDLVIKNGNLVTRSGIHHADVGIKNGKIVEIAPAIKGREEISAEGMLVLPGGVDPHVHFEMPTTTTITSNTWETGSKAAAFGKKLRDRDQRVESRYPKQPLLESFQERLSQAQGRSAIDNNFPIHLCKSNCKRDIATARGRRGGGCLHLKCIQPIQGFTCQMKKCWLPLN